MSEEKDLEKLAKRNYGDDSHFGKTSEENWSEFLNKMKTGFSDKISPQKEGDFEVIFHVYEILPQKKEEKKE
ncbi:MAG: hypothetical protein WC414_01310 [Patescibacteria group bacterium]